MVTAGNNLEGAAPEMTADEFRRIALSQAGAFEGSHFGHADFRVKKGVFATLGAQGPDHGMVKLTPDEQAMLVAAEPGVFQPVPGGWGRGGGTMVTLATADKATLESAIAMAWRGRMGTR